tara:strand:+ start:5312 stop:5872 length:561 start_codon:yes stop_codon:yes gene_type:complete
MKIKILIVVAFIIIAISAVTYDMYSQPNMITAPQNNVQTAMSLPNITAPLLLNEGDLNIHNLKEPIILLNFWASWCTVCMAEMDDLFKLVSDMDGKVALVTLSIDEVPEHALKAYKFLEARYPESIQNKHIYWLFDADKNISLKTFNVNKTPETIIIDHQRNMVDKIVGVYDWSSESIRQKLKSYL